MSPSKSAAKVLDMPAGDLEIVQAIVLDWDDGPVEGYLKLAEPATAWRFRLLAERHEDDDLDSRLYLLSEVPAALWEALRETAEGKEGSSGPLWVPSWQFSSEQARAAADRAVGELENAASEPGLVARITGSLSIAEVWLVKPLR